MMQRKRVTGGPIGSYSVPALRAPVLPWYTDYAGFGATGRSLGPVPQGGFGPWTLYGRYGTSSYQRGTTGPVPPPGGAVGTPPHCPVGTIGTPPHCYRVPGAPSTVGTPYSGFGAFEFNATQVWANWQTCAGGSRPAPSPAPQSEPPEIVLPTIEI